MGNGERQDIPDMSAGFRKPQVPVLPCREGPGCIRCL